MSDEWNTMTGNQESSFDYGQEYNYNLPDGISSGVASYEPQIGGDENPWRKPVFFDEEKLLAPDDEHYLEEPFGESFFPSPSVGYSRVTVKNLQRKNVHRNATGSVVHEFYTTKDFPTITGRTGLDAQREKSDPFSLSSLFQIDVKDYMTASQGYVIELNDMNGKPKSQNVYQESQTVPITSVEYHYKQTPYLNGSFRLDNQVAIIYKDGTINNNGSIGIFNDYTSDFRESVTTNQSSAMMVNVDVFMIAFVPVPIPTLWPSFTNETTRFRSAVITKVIQRFGILVETIAKDLGSVVSTKNLAYDAETGEVLLTQTSNDFNDPVYSFTYPAHWYYDGMGPAYKNIGFATSLNFSSGAASVPSANFYFAEGDELELTGGIRAWVVQVNGNAVNAVLKNGANVPNGAYTAKIIRSGRRNQQVTPIAKITTLTNPLNSLQSNSYQKILQASSMEFTNSWRTYCDCFKSPGIPSTNPFILGTKGSWRQKKSYLYLTARTQSNFDDNTNIRKDGIFTGYTPFYKLSGGQWVIDPRNWTYTTEVTEFSPYGMELENKDALGRFSAATYGYNQSFPTGVAANSRYSDIGTDNFEDYDFKGCADNHFKFDKSIVTINETESHTGRRSIEVNSGNPVNLTKPLVPCIPTNPCNLSLCYIFHERSNFTLQATGGTTPYIFDWNILNGQAGVMLDANNCIVVNYSSGGIVTLQITITDSKNCTFTTTATIQGQTINLPRCVFTK
jgi:hypothetical protein